MAHELTIANCTPRQAAAIALTAVRMDGPEFVQSIWDYCGTARNGLIGAMDEVEFEEFGAITECLYAIGHFAKAVRV